MYAHWSVVTTALTVLTTLAVSPAFAEPPIGKLVSTDLARSERRVGSGFVYRSGNRYLFMTSEHVGYNGNVEVSHSIRFEGQPSVRARYVAAEWANGLAIYAIEGELAAEVADTARPLRCAPVPKPGGAVQVGGYPTRSSSALWSDTGRVTQVSIDPEMLLDVPNLVQIEGSAAEHGMSGGPVFPLGDDRPLGFLTAKKSATEDVVWVIPCEIALAWAREAESTGYLPRYHRFDGASVRVDAGPLSLAYSPHRELSGPHIDAQATRTAGPPSSRTPDNPHLAAVSAYVNRWTAISRFYYPRAIMAGFTRDSLRDPSRGSPWRRDRPRNLIDGLRRLREPNLRPYVFLTREGDNVGPDLNQLSSRLNAVRYFFGAGPADDRMQGLAWAVQEGQRGWQTDPAYVIGFLKLGDIRDLLENPDYASRWRDIERANPDSARRARSVLQDVLRVLSDYII